MSESCCTGGNKVMILSCSGGSNVGQIANQAAIELTQEGKGKLSCLAAIGGGLSGFVQSAKDLETVVVDGCPVGCAKAIFDKEGIPMKNYMVVTDLGIEKKPNFDLKRDQIDKTKDAICKFIDRIKDEDEDDETSTSCGCSCGCC